MKIALAAVADSANVDTNGKLNILGAFDTIRARKFPCRHPSLVLAFRVLGEYEDQQKSHRLTVTLLDADSKVLFQAEAEIKVGEVPPGQFGHNNQILTFRDAIFPKPGRYRFRLAAEGSPDPFDVIFQVVQGQGQPAQ
jgi:hypothetical protein